VVNQNLPKTEISQNLPKTEALTYKNRNKIWSWKWRHWRRI